MTTARELLLTALRVGDESTRAERCAAATAEEWQEAARLAGLVWIRCTPFGLGLLWLVARIRGIGGRVLRRLQRVPAFRAWGKQVRPAYIIQEASQSDLIALYAWLDPNGEQALPASERNANPNLTNYVARRGERVLGFVRVMRHSETDFPHTGHWLYSLAVRTRYRGMGVGEALTQRVLDQSRVEGASECCLCVFENNAPAIALYRKLGFEQVVLPALEEELAADVEKYGRRRVTLRKGFA